MQYQHDVNVDVNGVGVLEVPFLHVLHIRNEDTTYNVLHSKNTCSVTPTVLVNHFEVSVTPLNRLSQTFIQ